MTAGVPGIRAAVTCPDHPDLELVPLPGGAARGMCPADGTTYQMETPEVTP
jgi:hypothetical protein